MLHRNAQYWIDALGLEKHPEGGYFKECYRAVDTVEGRALPLRYSGARQLGTSIYFLLESSDFSTFHRLQSDEIWHYYAGSAGTIHQIAPDGTRISPRIGPDFGGGERFQVLIPHNTWFAAAVDTPDSYLLVGCTVCPGFDFADFEMADRQALASQYPEHGSLIEQFTR